jgi:hypothetical protein
MTLLGRERPMTLDDVTARPDGLRRAGALAMVTGRRHGAPRWPQLGLPHATDPPHSRGR